MQKGQSVHFIGIGGYGMGPLAKIMLDMGFNVSGSDMKVSERTDRLKSIGADVYIGHSEGNLKEGTDFIVVSAAVPESNPEIQKAKRLGVPVYTHAEMVGKLLETKTGIGISGAHGKTTTTSMVSMVLHKSGLSPTMLIGGEVDEFSGGGKLGNSSYFVIEADEAYGRFLKMHPKIAAVTNIDDDHLDYYRTFDNVFSAFVQFIEGLPKDGLAILNIDDPNVKRLAALCSKRMITYSTRNKADLWASDAAVNNFGSTFNVHKGGELLGEIHLSVPGMHNVSNALVAVAVGFEAGLSFLQIASALEAFRGVHRRFELHGNPRDVMIVDDYAHHPTEIKAVLKAARDGWNRRIIAVFQPQRFTRTQLLMDEFAEAFGDADITVICDIYYEGTGEEPIPGVTSAKLVELIREDRLNSGLETGTCIHLSSLQEVVRYIKSICRKGDLVITMGAGDVWTVAKDLGKELETSVNTGDKVCR